MFDKLTQWFIQKLNEYQKRNPVEWYELGITLDNQWSENPIKIQGKKYALRIYTIDKKECIFQLLENKLIHVKARYSMTAHWQIYNMWMNFEYQSFNNGVFLFESEPSVASLEIFPTVTKMCEDVFGFEFHRYLSKDKTTSQTSLIFKTG